MSSTERGPLSPGSSSTSLFGQPKVEERSLNSSVTEPKDSKNTLEKHTTAASPGSPSPKQKGTKSTQLLHYEEIHNGNLHAEGCSFVKVPTRKIVQVLCNKYLSPSQRGEAPSSVSPVVLNNNKEIFFEFVESLGAVVQCYYSKQCNFVKEYWETAEYPAEDEMPPLPEHYRQFAPPGGFPDQVANQTEGMTESEAAEFERKQKAVQKYGLDLRLLDRLSTMLDRAQFRALTPKLFRLACQTNYEINFPLDVPWDEMQDEMLPLWIQCNEIYSAEQLAEATSQDDALFKHVTALPPQLRSLSGNIAGTIGKQKDDFFNYFLVFTRGVTQQSRRGFFLFEKIDIALELLWTWVLYKIGWLEGGASVDPATALEKFKKAGASNPIDFSESEAELKKRNQLRAGSPRASPLPSRSPSPRPSSPSPNAGGEISSGPVDGEKTLKLTRFTLRQHLLQKGVSGFFQFAELHEPHFDSVVLLHRRLQPTAKPTAAVDKKSEGPEKNKEAQDESHDCDPQQPHARTALRIREFRDIPYGDLEAVIPSVKIGMPPLDTVKFVVQLVAMVWFIKLNFDTIFEAETERPGTTDGEHLDNGTTMLLVLLLFGLGGKLVGLLFYYMGVIVYYRQILENWLLTKRVGQGPVIISSLCDDVVFQETRELVLAYFFLWRETLPGSDSNNNQGVMTMPQVDKLVEDTLATEFQLHIDFDAEDALNKLVNMKLVERLRVPLRGDVGYRVLTDPKRWNLMHPVSHMNTVGLHDDPM